MSTLRVDTLQNRSGGDLITAKGMARAWVNFNGTGTVAIRSAFNVTSITDNGTGNYTLNFTAAMDDANYAVLGTGGDAAAFYQVVHVSSVTAPTVSAVRVATVVQSSGQPVYADASRMSVAIFD